MWNEDVKLQETYLQAWQTLGIPAPDAEFAKTRGDDEAKYFAFESWVQDRVLSGSLLSSVLDLVALEPDSFLQKGMLRMVIDVTVEDELTRLFDIDEEQVRSWVEEEIILRELDHPQTEERLMELSTSPFRKVQLKLVAQDALPISVLESLVATGMTKAVRNQAHIKLGRKGPVPKPQ